MPQHVTNFTSSRKAKSRKFYDRWSRASRVIVRRVEITDDTKIPNAATVKVVKQDHTLANMVRG